MDLISLLISVIIVGVIVWLLIWALDYIGIPEPFNKIARILVIVIAVVWLLSKFLPLAKL